VENPDRRIVCFDLDDTLIPNTCLYHGPIWKCGQLISRALGPKSPYPRDVLTLHYEIDSGMVKTHGYGADRFPESWVRTYETLAERAHVPVDRAVSKRLRATAARFKNGPYVPFPGAKDALVELQHASHMLHLVTAGEKRLQQRKLDRCGLKSLFDSTHIVKMDKKSVLEKLIGDEPRRGIMIGDSKRSDILPALELGMEAIWVKSGTWPYAQVDIDQRRFHTVDDVTQVPALVRRIVREGRRRKAARARRSTA
jgi:putative hydrolase of the HAD superfamily